MIFKPTRTISSRKPKFSTPSNEEASPVRHIKPPKRSEPAETRTIATIILRRNYKLFEGCNTSLKKLCYKLYHRSQQRELTQEEAENALAFIAELKGRK